MVGFGRLWLARDDRSTAHAGDVLSWVLGVTSRSPAVGVDGVELGPVGMVGLEGRAPGWLDQNFFQGRWGEKNSPGRGKHWVSSICGGRQVVGFGRCWKVVVER